MQFPSKNSAKENVYIHTTLVKSNQVKWFISAVHFTMYINLGFNQ